jgi:hypothetical protein
LSAPLCAALLHSFVWSRFRLMFRFPPRTACCSCVFLFLEAIPILGSQCILYCSPASHISVDSQP